ncbi:MAG: glucosamine-6-phosphate isomerase [Oscillospiraceae bacterium]|nr:glucosamine-6-phosphate isomerase [Oscillospiraceae bacterium]
MMTPNEYYGITKENIEKNAKIQIQKMNPESGDDGVYRALAIDMIDTIDDNEDLDKPTVIILPVGPVGQYKYFVDEVNEDNISLKNCWFINMDEYLNDNNTYIDINSPLSFRGFMEREVYSKIKPWLLMPEEQRIFPDPANPERVDLLLKELGGADICIGGIGLNGHIAFNEPMPKLNPKKYMALTTRIVELSPETKIANGIPKLNGAVDMMPKKAITLGMKSILASKKIRLGVFRDWHKAVLRHAAFGEVSTSFPVTLLQNHPDSIIYSTDFAAELPYEDGTV